MSYLRRNSYFGNLNNPGFSRSSLNMIMRNKDLSQEFRISESGSNILSGERSELSQLNYKFANYIERIKFLEVRNKWIEMQLGFARKKRQSLKVPSQKELYLNEIKDAIRLLEDIKKEKAEIEENLATAKNELAALDAQALALHVTDVDLTTLRQREAKIETELLMLTALALFVYGEAIKLYNICLVNIAKGPVFFE
ncbi:hypothetical protein ACOME3_002632 [Neoechinorhynchus agilis]